MADNTNTIRDSAGEYDDWLELYNESASAVSVGGMFLTDDPLKSTKWQIPAGTSIPGEGTLLIWCDEDQNQGKYHANFKLSSQGEEALLFDRDGKTVLSTIKFGALDPDVSVGWLHDGKPTTLVAYRKHNGQGVGATPDEKNDPDKGPREYWPLDYGKHRLFLRWGGLAQLNSTNVILGNGPPNSVLAVLLGTSPTVLRIGGGLHFMLGGTLSGPIHLNVNATGQGLQLVTVPNDQNLVGVKLYLQAGAVDNLGFTVSNGAQVGFSK